MIWWRKKKNVSRPSLLSLRLINKKKKELLKLKIHGRVKTEGWPWRRGLESEPKLVNQYCTRWFTTWDACLPRLSCRLEPVFLHISFTRSVVLYFFLHSVITAARWAIRVRISGNEQLPRRQFSLRLDVRTTLALIHKRDSAFQGW